MGQSFPSYLGAPLKKKEVKNEKQRCQLPLRSVSDLFFQDGVDPSPVRSALRSLPQGPRGPIAPPIITRYALNRAPSFEDKNGARKTNQAILDYQLNIRTVRLFYFLR